MTSLHLRVSYLIMILVGLASTSSASTIVVANSGDAGAGSLRQAVIDAVDGDTISFGATTNGTIINLTTQILIDEDITIIGNDTTQTILDGLGTSRIFEITSGATVAIEGLTIQNGGGVTEGGGVKNEGELTLSDCKVIMNLLSSASATLRGGGVHNIGTLTIRGCDISYNSLAYTGGFNFKTEGGGIYNEGGLTISTSDISHNEIESNGSRFIEGGGIYTSGNNSVFTLKYSRMANNLCSASGTDGARGGAIYISNGTLTITNVEITDNRAVSMDDIATGGGVSSSSTEFIIRNSKITGNEARGFNRADGGGLEVSNFFKAYNTVISGNIAHTTSTLPSPSTAVGGGLRINDGTMNNCTIAGNEASNENQNSTARGGGIFTNGALKLKNTIIAKNIAITEGSDIRSSNQQVIDLGNNHVMHPSGGHGVTSGNDIDPMFLADVPSAPNTGGDLRLLCTSTAVDGGTPDTTEADVGLIDLDSLPRVVGAHIDIGAYERLIGCHEIEVLGDGIEMADSATIDFGIVCDQLVDTLYIKNAQAHFLIIDTITMDSAGVDLSQLGLNVGSVSYPDTLARGDSLLLIITFTPISGSADTAIVRIQSNDTDESVYDVVLVASGDLDPPIVSCKDTTITLDVAGNVSIDSSFVLASFSDNCGIQSVLLSKDSFGIPDIGTQTVDVTVSDGANSASCTSEVTITTPCSTVVTNTNDSGCGSLRFVISEASVGDTITFYPSINGDTIILTSGQILLNKDLVISGNGMDSTIIDGNGNDRIFEVPSQRTVNLKNLSIQNGGNVSQGGGIQNEGVLKLTDCTLQNNKTTTLTSSRGGAIYNRGDSLIIDNCRILNNQSTISAGGIYSSNSSGTVVQIKNSAIENNTIVPVGTTGASITGGGISNAINSKMTIESSIISGNSINTVGNNSVEGGGIHNSDELTIAHCEVRNNETFSEESLSSGGGIYNNNGTITIESSKIISNTASSNRITLNTNPTVSGGGIYSTGTSANLIVFNSTIAGNTIGSLNGKGRGAGIYLISGSGVLSNTVISGNIIDSPTAEGAGVHVQGSLSFRLLNLTIAGNRTSSTSASGGGLYVNSSTIDVVNTIITNTDFNGQGADIRNISSTINDLGHNHIYAADGGHGITSGNNIDPLFVMDVDTSGGMATTSGDLRLACGSPAIDAGTPDTVGLNLGLVDIAGLSRVQGTIDIGAHERSIPCPELSDCSQVNINLDFNLLTNSDPIALFRAQTELTSDAIITRDISTQAGQVILFEKNFTVNQGVVLQALIENCSN